MTDLWPWILATASAIVLFSNAIEKIVKAVKVAKSPNDRQNQRLDTIEEDVKTLKSGLAEVNDKLAEDYGRFISMDDSNKITHRALLALLDHGIDGNNIEQMQHAKEALQDHLIDRPTTGGKK